MLRVDHGDAQLTVGRAMTTRPQIEWSTGMTIPLSVIGTIATTPRFAHTGSRAAYCSFRIASHDRRYDRESGHWIDGEVNWFTVLAFRGLAEHANASFAKGDRVIVSGRLRVRRWEVEEKSGTAVEIEADGLGHDLRFGTTSFVKQPARIAASTAGSSEAAGPGDPGMASLAALASAAELAPAPVSGAVPAPGAQDEETRSEDGFLPSAA